MFKNFFFGGTKESMMRLAAFLAMICIILVVADIVCITLIVVIKDTALDKLPPIIGALAQVIGALSLIVLYKGVQAFAENKSGEKNNEIKDSGTPQGEK